MVDSTSRPASPSTVSRTASARNAQPTGPSENIPPIDLTPAEAAELKDQEADVCIANGDIDGAIQALQKAIFFRPEHAPFHAKLARVYWDASDLKSAMACYRKLFSIDRNPSQRIKDQFASLLDLHGYLLLILGETTSVVIAYLSEAIQLNSLEETFWLHRALAHIQTNAFDKALKDVDHCVNLNGKDAEYFVLRAKLHWKLHMHEKATQDIHKAARLRPDHPEVVAHEHRLLMESQTIYAEACKHLLVHNFNDAIKCLTNAAEISPEETKIYLLRASAYREQGDLQPALRDIDQAMTCHKLKLDAAHSKKNPHTNHRQAADESSDHTREYRDIAIQRNLILNEMALRFLREQSFQVALNAMNQVIQGEVEIAKRFHEKFATPQYYVNRGDAYRGLGNAHAALADYHHAQDLVPDNQEIRSRVAMIHYQFGVELFNQAQFAKAEVEFERAITEDDRVPTFHVRKGDAARYQEKHHIACQAYMEAMRLNPTDADTRNKLLQYAVDPTKQLPSRTPAITTTSTRDRDAAPSSPSRRQPVELSTNLDQAIKSYQRKDKVVKDLFHNRPSLPPPKNKQPGR